MIIVRIEPTSTGDGFLATLHREGETSALLTSDAIYATCEAAKSRVEDLCGPLNWRSDGKTNEARLAVEP